LELKEHEPLGKKNTMRIGGTARWFTDLKTKADVEEAWKFAHEKQVPFIMLGGGSNTIFADGEVNALVVRIAAMNLSVEKDIVTVESGLHLATLIVKLTDHNLDLSSLTGIPGTLGGAIFGNAGQGPAGIWIDRFVESIEAFVDGKWKTFTREECDFAYRESGFKRMKNPPIIWSAVLRVPAAPKADVLAEMERLLKKRLETQPHIKTAGSCFKAVGGTPAWQLIDAAGLRGMRAGGVQISEKHANFLINEGSATFEDAVNVVETVRSKVSAPLDVEMRFIREDGSLRF
jgi:UDP-N-acetylmuramate dehydrogenase